MTARIRVSTAFILILFILAGQFSVFADTDTCCENQTIGSSFVQPRYFQTETGKKTVRKTFSTDNGNVTIEFDFYGTYSYDLGSGKIMSAYDPHVNSPTVVSSPGEFPELWKVELKNVSTASPEVASDGSKATFRLNCTVVVKYQLGGGDFDYKNWSFPISEQLVVYAH